MGIQKHWSKILLDILQVKYESQGYHRLTDMRGRLLVANHVSWLDVIVLNAVDPACFIAKSEVRNWPMLGWLCSRVGTLFIKRESRRDSIRINRKISWMLKQGENVALFPEGTSTDGGFPGHFHSSLLQGAIDVNASISPVAIRYHDGAGNASSDAAYVDDMSFLQSLWRILCSPSLHVNLVYLPTLTCADKNRRLLASDARESICNALEKFSPGHPYGMQQSAMPSDWERAVSNCLP